MSTIWRGERGSVTTSRSEINLFRVNGCVGGEVLKNAIVDHSGYPPKIRDYFLRVLDISSDKLNSFLVKGGFLFTDGRNGTLSRTPDVLQEELERKRLMIATVKEYKEEYGLDFGKITPCDYRNYVSLAAPGIREGLVYSLGHNNTLFLHLRVQGVRVNGSDKIEEGFAGKIEEMWRLVPYSIPRPFVARSIVKQQLYDLSEGKL